MVVSHRHSAQMFRIVYVFFSESIINRHMMILTLTCSHPSVQKPIFHLRLNIARLIIFPVILKLKPVRFHKVWLILRSLYWLMKCSSAFYLTKGCPFCFLFRFLLYYSREYIKIDAAAFFLLRELNDHLFGK